MIHLNCYRLFLNTYSKAIFFVFVVSEREEEESERWREGDNLAC